VKKLLIFGKHGQVGSALCAQLAHREEDYQWLAIDKEELDLTQIEAVKQAVLDASPDWVINTAAYTAVDRAEEDEETARLINAAAPAAMAEACQSLGVPFFHYSTDYVFDGEAIQPYVETDPTNPQGVYGQTKLEGELAVMAAQPDSLILRTAWVYSKDGQNFVNTMLRVGKDKESLNVVSDQFGSPTLAWDLAEATISMIDQTPAEKVAEVAGIYHATGSGVANWSGFAQTIFDMAGYTTQVKPIPSSEYPTLATRPMYSVLSNQKLKNVFGLVLPDWHESLQKTLA